MQKTLEDSSPNQALTKTSYLTSNKSCLKDEGDVHSNIADRVTDYSPSERECRSEEMEGNYSTDCDNMVHKNSQIKKSQSLGNCLNWEERSSGADDSEDAKQRSSYDGSANHSGIVVQDGADGSEDAMKQKSSYDGSANQSGIVVQDDINSRGPADHFQEPVPSDSVQVGSDFAKNISIFSIGDPQQTEKEDADKDDIYLSGVVDSGDLRPCGRHSLVKSSSLPTMGSPNQCSKSLFTHSRSAEDLNNLDSMKKGTMHEVERRALYQERENLIFNDGKNNGENPADGIYETYNYVDSAKDWIIPVSNEANTGEGMKGETSYDRWDEVPTKDFRLKRIEEWVINLQHCDPLEESDESALYYDKELGEGTPALEGPSAAKLEVKVSPGMEAAKRYISSLNASATAAQLTNLGLVVIPFLSAFVSLKALNLSGNDIGLFLAICSFTPA